MRVKIIENFRYGDKEYEKGEIVDLPESVGKSVVEKGYGEQTKETPTIQPTEIKKKKGPKWKRKIWISEDRNINISIWPPGEKFDSPSITLEENRRNESGNWETDRLYLPTGSTLLALSEHLKSAWNEVQKIRTEEVE